MEKPKNRPKNRAENRPAHDGESVADRRKPRRNSAVPHATDDEAELETYEQSPERPGADISGGEDNPDGPMPRPERPTPD